MRPGFGHGAMLVSCYWRPGIRTTAVRALAKMTQAACGALALSLAVAAPVHAQSTFSDLKGKLFDARMAVKTFVNGLRHCKELDGTNFYFEPRNRVLNLEEYHQSLDNLVKAQVYNPEKRRPWSEEDANARWEQVKKEALHDKEICKLVELLPQLEKRVKEMEGKRDASQDKSQDKSQVKPQDKSQDKPQDKK